MFGQARRVPGLLLMALSLASVSVRAQQAPPGEPQLISPQSIKGAGEYVNSESLIIDGQTPPEESAWDADQCTYWTSPKTRFVLTLDAAYQITGLTLQADNNDDYVIEASMDGKAFSPLLVVKGEWGEVFTGIETLSTLTDDPHFRPEMVIKPAQAKYVRLSARGGDEAYSVSELLVYGSKVQSEVVPTVVVTDGGSTTLVTQGEPIKAKSIKGSGEFSHAAKLIIDQKMPKQGTLYDNKSCVYWSDPKTSFVIDLGAALWITGLTIQADNNDDYVIAVSTDGKAFKPLLTVRGEWGDVFDGMETLSTLAKDPQHVAEMAIKPAQARYVRLDAKGGDEAYSVSELLLYGSKTAPVPQGSIGTGQPPEGTPGSSGVEDMSLESVFNAVDTNHDGKISKDEYAAIWKDKLDVDKNFAFFDRDNSGYIEKAEFMSLREGLMNLMSEDQAGQDESGQSDQTQEQSTKLDPVLVQKAIDALPKYAQITALLEAGKYDEIVAIVKEAGFENWLTLNYYYATTISLAQSAQESPETMNALAGVFGQAAVDLITKPANLAKIMQYVPR